MKCRKITVFTALLLALCVAFSGVVCAAPPREAEECEHTFGEWERLTPALIFHNEVQRRTCTRCGETVRAKVPATAGVFRVFNSLCRLFVKSGDYSLPEGFTVTAHSGAMLTPDNSLLSMWAGMNCGAQTVEFDLNYNAGGECVLDHDTPEGGEVTLESAFKFLAKYKGVTVNVDVKNTAGLADVQALALKYGIIDRIFYTGLGAGSLDEARQKSPLVACYLNCSPKTDEPDMQSYCRDFAAAAEAMGVIGLNLSFSNASPELIAAAHEHGLLVSLWTATKPDEIKTVLSLAPDNITSKNPALALAMK